MLDCILTCKAGSGCGKQTHSGQRIANQLPITASERTLCRLLRQRQVCSDYWIKQFRFPASTIPWMMNLWPQGNFFWCWVH